MTMILNLIGQNFCSDFLTNHRFILTHSIECIQLFLIIKHIKYIYIYILCTNIKKYINYKNSNNNNNNNNITICSGWIIIHDLLTIIFSFIHFFFFLRFMFQARNIFTNTYIFLLMMKMYRSSTKNRRKLQPKTSCISYKAERRLKPMQKCFKMLKLSELLIFNTNRCVSYSKGKNQRSLFSGLSQSSITEIDPFMMFVLNGQIYPWRASQRSWWWGDMRKKP